MMLNEPTRHCTPPRVSSTRSRANVPHPVTAASPPSTAPSVGSSGSRTVELTATRRPSQLELDRALQVIRDLGGPVSSHPATRDIANLPASSARPGAAIADIMSRLGISRTRASTLLRNLLAIRRIERAGQRQMTRYYERVPKDWGDAGIRARLLAEIRLSTRGVVRARFKATHGVCESAMYRIVRQLKRDGLIRVAGTTHTRLFMAEDASSDPSTSPPAPPKELPMSEALPGCSIASPSALAGEGTTAPATPPTQLTWILDAGFRNFIRVTPRSSEHPLRHLIVPAIAAVVMATLQLRRTALSVREHVISVGALLDPSTGPGDLQVPEGTDPLVLRENVLFALLTMHNQGLIRLHHERVGAQMDWVVSLNPPTLLSELAKFDHIVVMKAEDLATPTLLSTEASLSWLEQAESAIADKVGDTRSRSLGRGDRKPAVDPDEPVFSPHTVTCRRGGLSHVDSDDLAYEDCVILLDRFFPLKDAALSKLRPETPAKEELTPAGLKTWALRVFRAIAKLDPVYEDPTGIRRMVASDERIDDDDVRTGRIRQGVFRGNNLDG